MNKQPTINIPMYKGISQCKMIYIGRNNNKEFNLETNKQNKYTQFLNSPTIKVIYSGSNQYIYITNKNKVYINGIEFNDNQYPEMHTAKFYIAPNRLNCYVVHQNKAYLINEYKPNNEEDNEHQKQYILEHLESLDRYHLDLIDIQCICSRNVALFKVNRFKQSLTITSLWACKKRNIPQDIVNLIADYIDSLNQDGIYWQYHENDAKYKHMPLLNEHSEYLHGDIKQICKKESEIWAVVKDGTLYKRRMVSYTWWNKIEYLSLNKIKIDSIACGSNHILALTYVGKVYGWGYSIMKRGEYVNEPKQIYGLNEYNIIEVNCGGHHSYCKSSDDKYYLFGRNTYNECLVYEWKCCFVEPPNCINEVVYKMSNGRNIECVSLGMYNTKIVLQ
eukprot:227906_1